MGFQVVQFPLHISAQVRFYPDSCVQIGGDCLQTVRRCGAEQEKPGGIQVDHRRGIVYQILQGIRRALVMRDRYTVLFYLRDQGLLEEYSERATDMLLDSL